MNSLITASYVGRTDSKSGRNALPSGSTTRRVVRATVLSVTLTLGFGTAQSFAADSLDASLDTSLEVSGTASQSTPADWLKRMNSAFTELDYDGFLSFWGGSNMASLRVVHLVKEGIEHERLVHLNGAPREVLREGEKVTCIMQPGDELAAVSMASSIPSGPFARAFIRDFSDVSSNYDLAMRGEDRIAARTAVRMVVTPRDKHRYGYRMWLDKETGLLLKSELMDEKQRSPLEVFQFNRVVMGAEVNANALEPEQIADAASGSLVDHLSLADNAVQPTDHGVKWHASWLPGGFEMASADLRHAPATAKDVSTLMYSDGLAAVSVFVESMPNAPETKMMTRKGATVSVTQLVLGPDDTKHLVTVIGEVPPATASAIASKVAYAE